MVTGDKEKQAVWTGIIIKRYLLTDWKNWFQIQPTVFLERQNSDRFKCVQIRLLIQLMRTAASHSISDCTWFVWDDNSNQNLND